MGSQRSSRKAGRVALPPQLRRIRGCESGSGPRSAGDYRAENPTSTASGAYQFLNGTWRSVTGKPGPASRYSRAEQDRAAVELYAGGRGAHHWNASRRCWQ